MSIRKRMAAVKIAVMNQNAVNGVVARSPPQSKSRARRPRSPPRWPPSINLAKYGTARIPSQPKYGTSSFHDWYLTSSATVRFEDHRYPERTKKMAT